MRQAFPRWVRFAALVSAIVLLQLLQSGCKHKLASEQLTAAQQQLAANVGAVTKLYLDDHIAETFSAGSNYTSWKGEVESEAKKYFGN